MNFEKQTIDHLASIELQEELSPLQKFLARFDIILDSTRVYGMYHDLKEKNKERIETFSKETLQQGIFPAKIYKHFLEADIPQVDEAYAYLEELRKAESYGNIYK